MQKRLILLLVLILGTAWFVSTATAGDRYTVQVRGVITEVNRGGIVFSTDRGEGPINVTRYGTYITRNGRPARLRDLQVGDEALILVQIVRDRRGNIIRFDAITIRARGQ